MPRIIGLVASSFEGEPHFRLGNNIVVRYGNLLDDYSMSNLNAIVLPACVTGTPSGATAKLLDQRKILRPAPDAHGSIKRANTSPSVKNRVYWAYSVSDQNITELKTIDLICRQLIADESQGLSSVEGEYYQVGIPLLGTRSGKMDVLEVASLFHHHFNNRQDSIKIVLTVTSQKTFNLLQQEQHEIISPTKAYIHSEEYKVKVELDAALNVEHVAHSLTLLLDRFPIDKGVIVGIFGRWGRGKTYLMTEIWKQVEKGTAKTIAPARVNFHAWKYQDTPAVWAYLYEQFSEAYLAAKKCKWKANFLLNVKRNGRSRPIWFLIGLLFSVGVAFVSFKAKQEFLTQVFSLVSIGTVVSLCITYFRYAGKAKSIYQEYLFKPSFVKVLGLQAEIQRELAVLMQCWAKELSGRRLVLFVDDIDRCPEDMVIKIVDALRVMVEDASIAGRVIVFISVDDRILRRAIRHKFHTLYGESGVETVTQRKEDQPRKDTIDDLVSEYIDKLFISGIRLGDLTPKEMDEVLLAVMDSELEEAKAAVIGTQAQELTIPAEQSADIRNSLTEMAAPAPTAEVDAEQNKEQHSKPPSRPAIPASMILAEFEAARLRTSIGQLKTLTPRQIKITYYRYLLARTLLVGLCANARLSFIWLEADNNEILIALLLHYSQPKNREALEQERLRISGNKDRLSDVPAKNNILMPTEHYSLLLDSLNMVIAY